MLLFHDFEKSWFLQWFFYLIKLYWKSNLINNTMRHTLLYKKDMMKKECLRALFILMMYLYSYILEEGRIEKILYEKDLWTNTCQEILQIYKKLNLLFFFSWSIKTLHTVKLTYRTKQNTQTTYKTTKQKYGSSYTILFHRADYSQDSQSFRRCQLDGISQIPFSIWKNHFSQCDLHYDGVQQYMRNHCDFPKGVFQHSVCGSSFRKV